MLATHSWAQPGIQALPLASRPASSLQIPPPPFRACPGFEAPPSPFRLWLFCLTSPSGSSLLMLPLATRPHVLPTGPFPGLQTCLLSPSPVPSHQISPPLLRECPGLRILPLPLNPHHSLQATPPLFRLSPGIQALSPLRLWPCHLDHASSLQTQPQASMPQASLQVLPPFRIVPGIQVLPPSFWPHVLQALRWPPGFITDLQT